MRATPAHQAGPCLMALKASYSGLDCTTQQERAAQGGTWGGQAALTRWPCCQAGRQAQQQAGSRRRGGQRVASKQAGLVLAVDTRAHLRQAQAELHTLRLHLLDSLRTKARGQRASQIFTPQ